MAPGLWATRPPQDTRQRRRETDRTPPTELAPALNDVDALLEGIENAPDQEAIRKRARDPRQLLDMIWTAHNGHDSEYGDDP